MPDTFVIRCNGHREYEQMVLAAQNLDSAVRTYINLRSVPVEFVNEIIAFDATTGTEYTVTVQEYE